uniref:Uncharacterized protein n=1 Tax=viral metagenome TaxID=1070528 RepID=A0A6C0BRI1_9ZZZZ
MGQGQSKCEVHVKGLLETLAPGRTGNSLDAYEMCNNRNPPNYQTHYQYIKHIRRGYYNPTYIPGNEWIVKSHRLHRLDDEAILTEPLTNETRPPNTDGGTAWSTLGPHSEAARVAQSLG